MANEFECIGYMKNKLPGEGEFSMFVNENSYGSTGGFEWKFLDFCPELPHEHGRIFVHLLSIGELRRLILHELDHTQVTSPTPMSATEFVEILTRPAKGGMGQNIAALQVELTKRGLVYE